MKNYRGETWGRGNRARAQGEAEAGAKSGTDGDYEEAYRWNEVLNRMGRQATRGRAVHRAIYAPAGDDPRDAAGHQRCLNHPDEAKVKTTTTADAYRQMLLDSEK